MLEGKSIGYTPDLRDSLHVVRVQGRIRYAGSILVAFQNKISNTKGSTTNCGTRTSVPELESWSS